MEVRFGNILVHSVASVVASMVASVVAPVVGGPVVASVVASVVAPVVGGPQRWPRWGTQAFDPPPSRGQLSVGTSDTQWPAPIRASDPPLRAPYDRRRNPALEKEIHTHTPGGVPYHHTGVNRSRTHTVTL